MANKNDRDVVAETEYYALLYSKADADNDGRVSGREGAAFLRKSGLSDKDLEKVWELASHGNAFLTQKEFAVAMRLVALAQAGKPIVLEQAYNFLTLPRFADIPVPAQLPLKMSDQDLQKYDSLFAQADANHDGFVDGNEAKGFFSRAELPTTSLSAIWKLCERDSDGKLSKGEFRLAMHLIYWCLQGNPLPNTLPQTLIDQAMSTVLYTTNAQGLIMKPDNKAPSPFIASLIPGSQQNSMGNLMGNTPSQTAPKPANQFPQTTQPTPQQRTVTANSRLINTEYYPQTQPGYNPPTVYVQPTQLPVTPMGMGYMNPMMGVPTMTTQHVMNPGVAPHMSTGPHTTMGAHVGQVSMNPGMVPNSGMHTNVAPNMGYPMTSYPTASSQPMAQNPAPMKSATQMNTGNVQNSSVSTNPAMTQGGWNQNAPVQQQQQQFTGQQQQTAPITTSYTNPQSSGYSQGPNPSQATSQTQQPPKTATVNPSPFASSNSPFASSNSPFASSASPFASTNSPFASSNSPFSAAPSAFESQQTFESHPVQQTGKPKAAPNADPFGSSFAQNPNEPEWIPAESGHNYDQTKYVYQHSMPGTTFEMRANFSAELGNALNKVKTKQQQ